MSKENIAKFQEMLNGGTDLQQKLKEARTPEDVVAAAKAEGFDFSLEELEDYSKAVAPKGKLEDDELNEVTGGVYADGLLETTVGYGCKYWEPSDDLWVAAKGCCGSCKKFKSATLPVLLYVGVPGLCVEVNNSKYGIL